VAIAALVGLAGAHQVWWRTKMLAVRDLAPNRQRRESSTSALAWTPLVAPSEVSRATSLVDHAHFVLALGGGIPVQATRVDAASGPRAYTYIWWLLGPAASGQADLPPWLVNQHGRWVPRLNTLVDAGGPGEAHPGQFFCYARQRGALGGQSEVMLPEFAGVASIEAIIDGAASLARVDGDNDHLLPAILALTRRTKWERPYGDQISLDEIVLTHLDASPDARSCFGAHWLGAVHAAACDAGAARLSRAVRERAAR